MSRPVNTPRSSMCAVQWAHGPVLVCWLPCLCVGWGPGGADLSGAISVAQLTLPSPLAFPACAAPSHRQLPDWREFHFGTTHLEFRWKAHSLELDCLIEREYVGSLSCLHFFFPRWQFFKTSMEAIQVLILSQDFATAQFHSLIWTHTWQTCFRVQTVNK